MVEPFLFQLPYEKRKVGVEPTLTAPQAVVLPLHNIRHDGLSPAQFSGKRYKNLLHKVLNLLSF